ncbi:MAG: exosortase K [Lachnospiraceae bacterium]|nr:exosortase K [Lachnospiraceae bacterium]
MRKSLFIYLPAMLAVLAMKVFYRTADSDMLLWILTPTTWWVRVLSGISFEHILHVGYVSHEYRFIIAPSCSGVRFLLLTFVMIVFSYTHLIASQRKKICWLGFSAVFSYITTIFVNGIRITVSIYLPQILMNRNLMSGWLTAEKLHTIIGTSIYFSMLFAIYYLVGKFCRQFFIKTDVESSNKVKLPVTGIREPMFWYFVMVLGLPFIGRLYQNNWEGFWQYVLLVTGVCVSIVVLFSLFSKIGRVKNKY